jgi:TetR/AcrR family transcriptional regulator
MDNVENSEHKILKAAMNIFVKKGRYGAKMQEIADAAHINKAMLHYYFRTKENLYTKVFENVFAQGFSALSKSFETKGNFESKLIEFVEQYTSMIVENPQIPLFILRELSEGAEDVRPVFEEILFSEKFSLPQLFLENLQTAIDNGEIKNIDPRQIFITIIGSVAFFFIAEPLLSVFFRNDPEYRRDVFIKQRKKAIVNIILNGIKNQG